MAIAMVGIQPHLTQIVTEDTETVTLADLHMVTQTQGTTMDITTTHITMTIQTIITTAITMEVVQETVMMA